MNELSIIPAKIATCVPKPTKPQMIAALVERAREQHHDKLKKVNEDLKPLEEQLRAAVLSALKTATSRDIVDFSVGGSYDSKGIYFSGYIASPDIERQHAKCKPLRLRYPSTYFSEKDVRRQITEAMGTKTNPLLNNPDVKASLDVMLAALLNPQKTIDA